MGILLILHVVGLVGLSSSAWSGLFGQLSPVTLLLTCGLALLFHRQWDLRFALFAVLSVLLGFGVEVAGVKSGLLFGGDYVYGENLGPKWLEVPLLMGFLWFLLAFSSGTLVRSLAQRWGWLRRPVWFATAGALPMVLLDVSMEQLAARLGYWDWQAGTALVDLCGAAPWLNYLTWFSVAWLLLLAFRRWVKGDRINWVALAVLPIQLCFFILLNLTLRWI